MELVSKGEAARILGVTPSRVSQYLKEGKLEVVVDERGYDRIDCATLERFKALNPMQPRAPRSDSQKAAGAAPAKPRPAPTAGVPPRPPDRRKERGILPERAGQLPDGIVLEDGLFNINQAKAWGELERARRLQVERLAAEGKYMEVDKIKPTWERALVAIKRGVMAIPSRIKADNSELPIEIYEELEKLCRETLETAAKELGSILEVGDA